MGHVVKFRVSGEAVDLTGFYVESDDQFGGDEIDSEVALRACCGRVVI